MVEKLREEIDAITHHINFLWDDRSQSIEERGKQIDFLSKMRFKLECKIQDLNLGGLTFN
jgi:hypothetical protein|nr:MAG TPA: hypothetical protein [Caudoviricetes sp.]